MAWERKTDGRCKTYASICTVHKNRHHADVSKEHIILTGFIDVIYVCVCFDADLGRMAVCRAEIGVAFTLLQSANCISPMNEDK